MHFLRYKTFDHSSHSKHSTPLIYILASFLFVVVIIGSVVSWLSLNARTSPQITLKRMGRLRRVTRPQFQAARSVLDSGYDLIDVDDFKIGCRLFDDTDHGCGPGGECFYTRIDDFYTRACECKQGYEPSRDGEFCEQIIGDGFLLGILRKLSQTEESSFN